MERLFPSGVRTAVAGAGDAQAPLYQAEAEAVRKVVPMRRSEFAAGRACARRALGYLGIGAQDLPPGPDHAPRWPAGVVGTITHCRGFTGAAVGWRGPFLGLGLDAEPAEPLADHLVATVCTPAERRVLAAMAPAERGLWARLIFSAKEAVYKCVHPALSVRLDFQNVSLTLDRSAGRFMVTAEGGTAATPDLERLEGRFLFSPGHILTGACLAGAGRT